MRMQVITYYCLSLVIALLFYNKSNYNNLVNKDIKEYYPLKNRFVVKKIVINDKTKLFPLQKPFSVMKSGDSIAKFVYYIDRKKTFKINGINFNKVFLRFPLSYLDKEFLIGSKNEYIYTAFGKNDFLGVNSFFSFKERKKRKIGFIIPESFTCILSLDSVYKQNKEYVFKINYEFKDYSFISEEKKDYNFLPVWEIKEMYYTKNRGLIKAVVKNNKNGLIYTALPDN